MSRLKFYCKEGRPHLFEEEEGRGRRGGGEEGGKGEGKGSLLFFDKDYLVGSGVGGREGEEGGNRIQGFFFLVFYLCSCLFLFSHPLLLIITANITKMISFLLLNSKPPSKSEISSL